MMLPTIPDGALTLEARNTFGLSGDYSNGKTVSQPVWPDGMKDLVNSINRIDGRFVGVEDLFFYAGTAGEFNAFLKDYRKIQGLERHRLILHRGTGEAGSLAGGCRRSCDWKLQGRPGASYFRPGLTGITGKTAYILKVHFWTDGKITPDQVTVPSGVELTGDGLGQFPSNTNDMISAGERQSL